MLILFFKRLYLFSLIVLFLQYTITFSTGDTWLKSTQIPPQVVSSDKVCPPPESAPFAIIENFITWSMVKLPTLPKAELSKQHFLVLNEHRF